MSESCSGCGGPRDRSPQRYCKACHAAYMRGWRPGHPLNAEQKGKDSARSYAGVYKRRGHIVPEPCQECGEAAEMHHPDYSRPLKVVWLCRRHHLQLHVEQSRETIPACG